MMSDEKDATKRDATGEISGPHPTRRAQIDNALSAQFDTSGTARYFNIEEMEKMMIIGTTSTGCPLDGAGQPSHTLRSVPAWPVEPNAQHMLQLGDADTGLE